MNKIAKGGRDSRVSKDLARLLSDDFNKRDARRLAESINTDGDYEADFTASARILLDMPELGNDPEIGALLAKPFGVETAGKSSKKWPTLAIAASLLLTLFLSWQFEFVGRDKANVETLLRYVTRIGEQKNIKLSDGSVLTLNTGTEILVAVNDERRHVELKHGEVWFDIANDAQRPFTIELGERAVSVLGTKFTVFKQQSRFRLALVEGQVVIHDKQENVSKTAPLIVETSTPGATRLMPGQHRVLAGWVVEYNDESKQLSAYRPADLASRYSWTNGLIKFSEEPLYKLVNELNRYSVKKILIDDSRIMNMEVYAAVRIDQISQALKGLEKSLPIKVEMEFDRITITGSDDLEKGK